jgi:DNA-binding transcriptional regulator LsrR (DeoR family)
MAINYVPSTPELGIQPIGAVSVTVKNHPLGTIVKAFDATNGEGEFVYAPGVASNIVGALVTWNPVAKTTTIVTNTAKLGWPVAVSMAANTSASSYSWYQIGGVAQIKKTAIVAGIASRLYISGTAGAVFVTSTAGKMIQGALTVNSVASAATFTLALISRPCMEGIAT